MKPSEFTFSILALATANLIPLAGVFFFGWDAAFVLFLYWAENIVIGFFNILKMAFLKIYSSASTLELLFSIPFFCLHYGAFCAAHGYLLFALFNMGDTTALFAASETAASPVPPMQMLFSAITGLWRSYSPGVEWSVFCLFVSHGISFLQNYLKQKEYLYFTPLKLLLQPYKRIVLLHLTVIAGAVPVMMCGSPVFLVCLLVFLKTGMDIFLHDREHSIDSRNKAK